MAVGGANWAVGLYIVECILYIVDCRWWGKLGSFRRIEVVAGANWVCFAFLPVEGTGGLNLWRHALRAFNLFFVGTVCHSPCFRCCIVGNYATHYTTEQVKSQISKCKTVVSRCDGWYN